jgi:hypothetical protein
LAQTLPGRAEFGVIVDNLRREMELNSVDIRLRTVVDKALIEAEKPDAVIIATGAAPYRPEIELLLPESDNVYTILIYSFSYCRSKAVNLAVPLSGLWHGGPFHPRRTYCQ